ncbi:formin-2-like [Polyodon spathula]|uniref:formin-2-like n=1 Tax=Polyodon spathula TaxID=7913 RepID=UPI001B7E1267|nr:formin-2-like [Polyodon spathula]
MEEEQQTGHYKLLLPSSPGVYTLPPPSSPGVYTLPPPSSPGDYMLLPPLSPGDYTLLPPPLLPPPGREQQKRHDKGATTSHPVTTIDIVE